MPGWVAIALICAGGTAVLAALLVLLQRSGALFWVLYRLYTRTRLGLWYHRQQCASVAEPHTLTEPVHVGSLVVLPFAYLQDNYGYMCLRRLQEGAQSLGCQRAPSLTMVLTTHKHYDHAGGNEELLRAYPGLRVVGGTGGRVLAANTTVRDGTELQLGNLRVTAIATPCHTREHVMFHVTAPAADSPAPSALFTGDTLFVGGVGMFFEGNAEEMHGILYRRLTAVPDSALMFPGHEYALPNLLFSVWVEPSNEAAQEKLRWVQEQRDAKRPAIPSTLQAERRFNPFLRIGVGQLEHMPHAEAPVGPVGIMAALRKLRTDKPHLRDTEAKEH